MTKLILACFIVVPLFHSADAQVTTGADLLFSKHFNLIEGRRVGLVTNHTGVLSDGRHVADAIHENPQVQLVALFGPEHGIRGDAPAGETIEHGTDSKTGVPAYSLYGKIRKPTPEMLQGVEVLLYDIQDVGARFYTYISTMSLAMEAAAEHGIPFVVLDRPNPIRGTWTEGFIRDDTLSSFVGMHPIPIAYGMTPGELAVMINGEGWLGYNRKAALTVVRMEGWTRGMWYDQTGLKWIVPSPNIKTIEAATVYPGTCLIEGTNLSEGRGTEKPFEYITAPFLHGDTMAARLNAAGLRGVVFEPIDVIPKERTGEVTNPKHNGLRCSGVSLKVVDRNVYQPVRTAVVLISAVRHMYPSEFQWRTRGIDRLSGTPRFRELVDRGATVDEIIASWTKELEEFRVLRQQYLLY